MVARDAQGHLTLAAIDLALPSTAVTGQVTGPSNVPVSLAEVRIQGSGERTFSDSQGQYLLSDLETGSRTMLVAAQGYQPASMVIQINSAGALQTVNFPLVLLPRK
jgi:hypothetical protein